MTLRKVQTVDETKRTIRAVDEKIEKKSELKVSSKNKETIITKPTTSTIMADNKESAYKNTPQKPKLLLYETTVETASKFSKNDSSSILTDDDTDSVGSSVDTNFFNNILAGGKVEQCAQKVNDIESQLENLSISTPTTKSSVINKRDEELSEKLQQLDLIKETDEFKAFQQRTDEKSFLHCSAITLSSKATSPDKKSTKSSENNQTELEDIDEVIVLSDTSEDEEDEEDDSVQPAKQKSGEERFYNVTPSAANNSKLNSLVMNRINNFFDNVPEAEAVHTNNTTILSADLSQHQSLYVSETSIEEEDQDVSISKENSNDEEMDVSNKSTYFESEDNAKLVENENTASKNSNPNVDKYIQPSPPKTPSSNLISNKQSSESTPIPVTNSASSVQVTSVNSGQINISAVININIKISERSGSLIKIGSSTGSMETPEIESNNCNDDHADKKPTDDETNANDTPALSSNDAGSQKTQNNTIDNGASEKSQSDGHESLHTPVKETKRSSFKVDGSISVNETEQKLLHSMYGTAWKTPNVLNSFRKAKPDECLNVSTDDTPSRISKGFNLCK